MKSNGEATGKPMTTGKELSVVFLALVLYYEEGGEALFPSCFNQLVIADGTSTEDYRL